MVVVSSSTQASEVVQAFNSSKRVKWLTEMIQEMDLVKGDGKVPILVDSTNAVSAVSSLTDRNKHMGVYLAYLRMLVEQGVVSIYHIPREKNVADMLTKQGAIGEFQRFRKELFEPFIIKNESAL